MATFDVDECIDALLSFRRGERRPIIHEGVVYKMAEECKTILLEQPAMLELNAPIRVVGDVHGQFMDLLRLFEFGGLPPESNYLFLGDYVDRGEYGLETICLLMCFKIKYNENFFLLRGNHEAAPINRIYGFYDECLSPELQSLDQLKSIPRPTEIPDAGLICDLLWSDPEEGQRGWGESDRGVSFVFGEDVVTKFLARTGLDLIARAHQVVEDGYEFFAKRQLVTVFSAPNYCGEFDNAGAMMAVDEDLMCSFQVLKPADKTQSLHGGGGR